MEVKYFSNFSPSSGNNEFGSKAGKLLASVAFEVNSTTPPGAGFELVEVVVTSGVEVVVTTGVEGNWFGPSFLRELLSIGPLSSATNTDDGREEGDAVLAVVLILQTLDRGRVVDSNLGSSLTLSLVDLLAAFLGAVLRG